MTGDRYVDGHDDLPVDWANRYRQCIYRWHFEDVDLKAECFEPALPGSAYCPAHLVLSVSDGGAA